MKRTMWFVLAMAVSLVLVGAAFAVPITVTAPAVVEVVWVSYDLGSESVPGELQIRRNSAGTFYDDLYVPAGVEPWMCFYGLDRNGKFVAYGVFNGRKYTGYDGGNIKVKMNLVPVEKFVAFKAPDPRMSFRDVTLSIVIKGEHQTWGGYDGLGFRVRVPAFAPEQFNYPYQVRLPDGYGPFGAITENTPNAGSELPKEAFCSCRVARK